MFQKLFKIFSTYQTYDMGLGYIQGMNYIGAAMLVHSDEVVTFWLLVTLFEKYEVRDVFANGLAGSAFYMRKLERLINEYLPELGNHL
jgi:Rab GTPase-activating protein 1